MMNFDGSRARPIPSSSSSSSFLRSSGHRHRRAFSSLRPSSSSSNTNLRQAVVLDEDHDIPFHSNSTTTTATIKKSSPSPPTNRPYFAVIPLPARVSLTTNLHAVSIPTLYRFRVHISETPRAAPKDNFLLHDTFQHLDSIQNGFDCQYKQTIFAHLVKQYDDLVLPQIVVYRGYQYAYAFTTPTSGIHPVTVSIAPDAQLKLIDVTLEQAEKIQFDTTILSTSKSHPDLDFIYSVRQLVTLVLQNNQSHEQLNKTFASHLFLQHQQQRPSFLHSSSSSRIPSVPAFFTAFKTMSTAERLASMSLRGHRHIHHHHRRYHHPQQQVQKQQSFINIRATPDKRSHTNNNNHDDNPGHHTNKSPSSPSYRLLHSSQITDAPHVIHGDNSIFVSVSYKRRWDHDGITSFNSSASASISSFDSFNSNSVTSSSFFNNSNNVPLTKRSGWSIPYKLTTLLRNVNSFQHQKKINVQTPLSSNPKHHHHHHRHRRTKTYGAELNNHISASPTTTTNNNNNIQANENALAQEDEDDQTEEENEEIIRLSVNPKTVSGYVLPSSVQIPERDSEFDVIDDTMKDAWVIITDSDSIDHETTTRQFSDGVTQALRRRGVHSCLTPMTHAVPLDQVGCIIEEIDRHFQSIRQSRRLVSTSNHLRAIVLLTRQEQQQNLIEDICYLCDIKLGIPFIIVNNISTDVDFIAHRINAVVSKTNYVQRFHQISFVRTLGFPKFIIGLCQFQNICGAIVFDMDVKYPFDVRCACMVRRDGNVRKLLENIWRKVVRDRLDANVKRRKYGHSIHFEERVVRQLASVAVFKLDHYQHQGHDDEQRKQNDIQGKIDALRSVDVYAMVNEMKHTAAATMKTAEGEFSSTSTSWTTDNLGEEEEGEEEDVGKTTRKNDGDEAMKITTVVAHDESIHINREDYNHNITCSSRSNKTSVTNSTSDDDNEPNDTTSPSSSHHHHQQSSSCHTHTPSQTQTHGTDVTFITVEMHDSHNVTFEREGDNFTDDDDGDTDLLINNNSHDDDGLGADTVTTQQGFDDYLNPPSGTIVEQDIVRHDRFQFFLCSAGNTPSIYTVHGNRTAAALTARDMHSWVYALCTGDAAISTSPVVVCVAEARALVARVIKYAHRASEQRLEEDEHEINDHVEEHEKEGKEDADDGVVPIHERLMHIPFYL